MTSNAFVYLNSFHVRSFSRICSSKCPRQPTPRKPLQKCVVAVSAVSDAHDNAENKKARAARSEIPSAKARSNIDDTASITHSENKAGTEGVKRKRHLSAESRAKISAALKGRRKSDAHRESLRQRLSGQKNPMYGRKLSDETKQKISQALTGRRRKKGAQDDTEASPVLKSKSPPAETRKRNPPTSDTIERLRDVAKNSRLITSIHRTSAMRRSDRRARRESDEVKEQDVDQVLRRVASLTEPPDNVVRLLQKTNMDDQSDSEDDNLLLSDVSRDEAKLEDITSNDRASEQHPPSDNKMATSHASESTDIVDSNTDNEIHYDNDDLSVLKVLKKNKVDPRRNRKRKEGPSQIEQLTKCEECKGTGLIQCPNCVGTVGVVSPRCNTCFGAGGTFCDNCDGVGLLKSKK